MFLPLVSLLLDMWEWFYVLEYLFRVFLIAIRNHILFITGKDISYTTNVDSVFFSSGCRTEKIRGWDAEEKGKVINWRKSEILSSYNLSCTVCAIL